MCKADIHGVIDRRFVLADQAFGRVRLGKAQAVDRNGKIASGAGRHDRLGAATKHLDRIRKGQLLCNPRKRVVVAADDENADAGLVQPPNLLGQEPRRLHGRLVAVIEIAGEQQRVDPLVETEIDDAHESAARGVPDQFGEVRIAKGQRAERRIKMDVCRMDEAKGQDLPLPGTTAQ